MKSKRKNSQRPQGVDFSNFIQVNDRLGPWNEGLSSITPPIDPVKVNYNNSNVPYQDLPQNQQGSYAITGCDAKIDNILDTYSEFRGIKGSNLFFPIYGEVYSWCDSTKTEMQILEKLRQTVSKYKYSPIQGTNVQLPDDVVFERVRINNFNSIFKLLAPIGIGALTYFLLRTRTGTGILFGTTLGTTAFAFLYEYNNLGFNVPITSVQSINKIITSSIGGLAVALLVGFAVRSDPTYVFLVLIIGIILALIIYYGYEAIQGVENFGSGIIDKIKNLF